MDEQTMERMVKLAAENLRLAAEVLELRRRLSKHTPVGDPGMIKVKGDFRDADPDRVAAKMIGGAQGAALRDYPCINATHGCIGRVMQPDSVCAGPCDCSIVLGELDAILEARSVDAAALSEERLGDLEALQKKYTALREDWDVECSEVARLNRVIQRWETDRQKEG